MALENINGRMEGDSLANMLMIRKRYLISFFKNSKSNVINTRVMVFIIGQTGIFTMDNGKMENSMEREYIKQITKYEKDFGKMVTEFRGRLMENENIRKCSNQD